MSTARALHALPTSLPVGSLRWLETLLMHLGTHAADGRIVLPLSQAEINVQQGRPRGSGVVSRHLTRLSEVGVVVRRQPIEVDISRLRSLNPGPLRPASTSEKPLPRSTDAQASAALAALALSLAKLEPDDPRFDRLLDLCEQCSAELARDPREAVLPTARPPRVKDEIEESLDKSSYYLPSLDSTARSSPGARADLLDAVTSLRKVCANHGLPGVTDERGLLRALKPFPLEAVRNKADELAHRIDLGQAVSVRSPFGVLIAELRAATPPSGKAEATPTPPSLETNRDRLVDKSCDEEPLSFEAHADRARDLRAMLGRVVPPPRDGEPSEGWQTIPT